MTYGYCVYHKIDCDYVGQCIECPHNAKEDIEWFKQDEEQAEVKVSKSEVKSPKCSSAEGSSAVDEANIGLLDVLYNENVKLHKELKKVRKEKKRWKRKYFKLYNDAMILKNTVDAFNVLYNPNSSSLERIEAGFGIEPIKNIK